jgi:hypothetical protein
VALLAAVASTVVLAALAAEPPAVAAVVEEAVAAEEAVVALSVADLAWDTVDSATQSQVARVVKWASAVVEHECMLVEKEVAVAAKVGSRNFGSVAWVVGRCYLRSRSWRSLHRMQEVLGMDIAG